MYVYYCRTYEIAVSGGGEEKGEHVLKDTTSRGLCVRVRVTRLSFCPGKLFASATNFLVGWDTVGGTLAHPGTAIVIFPPGPAGDCPCKD